MCSGLYSGSAEGNWISIGKLLLITNRKRVKRIMMIPFFEQNCRNDLDDDDDTMIIFVSMIDVAITSWASRKNEPRLGKL